MGVWVRGLGYGSRLCLGLGGRRAGGLASVRGEGKHTYDWTVKVGVVGVRDGGRTARGVLQ